MNNKNTKFTTGAVAIILCFGICFVLLIFCSDSVINVGKEVVKSVYDFERVSVSTVIELAEEPEPTPNYGEGDDDPGGDNGDPGGVLPGVPTPQPPKPNVTLNPVSGTKIVFPKIGEPVDYVEINNKSNKGSLPRSAVDTVTWEFAYGWVSTTTDSRFQTMKSRAQKIAGLIVPSASSENDALMVNINGTRCYVGCSPISTFGSLGDIIRFTFTDGTYIDVLEIDAKAADDKEGTGFSGQVNTNYCHGVFGSDGLQLSAIELWSRTNATKGSVLPYSVKGKNVESAEIIAHTDVFN